MSDERVEPRVFALWVEDRPGVLNRVTSLFRRRGFNIESVTVGPARTAGISRMTIVVLTDRTGAVRIAAQLYKLVNVLRVEALHDGPMIRKELAMFKVSADESTRSDLIQLASATGARLVDVAPESLVFEATAAPEKIDGLFEVLRSYGLLEIVRTGLVGMTRGRASAMTDPRLRAAPAPVNPEEVEAGSDG